MFQEEWCTFLDSERDKSALNKIVAMGLGEGCLFPGVRKEKDDRIALQESDVLLPGHYTEYQADAQALAEAFEKVIPGVVDAPVALGGLDEDRVRTFTAFCRLGGFRVGGGVHEVLAVGRSVIAERRRTI